jgi:hypothetical protein
MNAPMTTNPITTALKNTVSLLEINTTALGLTRKDKVASARADADHHAAPGVARMLVDRLGGVTDLHNQFKGLHSEARENAFAFSSKWGENAQRLLPHANIEKWAVRHMQIVKTHDKLLEDLQDKADDIIASADLRLGDFRDRIEPPTKAELIRAYTLNHRLSPFPDDAGFDALAGKFPAETIAMFKQQYEADNAAYFRQGQNDLLKRLAVPVDHLISRLETYEQREKDLAAGKNPGKTGNFQESTVNNIKDVLAVLPSLNVTGDPRLTALADRLKLIMGVSAQDLKSNPDLRAKAIDDMKSAFKDSLLPGVE